MDGLNFEKMIVYRIWSFSNYLYLKGFKSVARIVYIFLRVTFSCDIPYSTKIGKNCDFKHDGLGIVINSNAIIGDNCQIGQNVTIGGRNGMPPPVIGDNVLIGANALVLGDISIGNNAVIGAGSVCLIDIPENAVAVGNPARIIKK